MMGKLFYYINSRITTGCYDFTRDTIILDSKLRGYPNLRRYVIEHELTHRKFGRNLWKHFMLDLKTFYYLHTEKDVIIGEYKKYRDSKKKENRRLGIWWIINRQCMDMCLQFVCAFTTLVFPFIWLYRKLFPKRFLPK